MIPNLRYPALNAKMKCMYANNLSNQDYEELLNQTNLKDAIIFLKNKFPVLENLNENMHRKAIEQELNNLFIYVILKLFKYLSKSETDIFMQILSKYKINCVKNVFRNVTTNTDMAENLKNIDNWTTNMFKQIDGINDITEETEFLELIKSEDYYKVFKEYEDIIDNAPLEEIEVKLDKFYFQKVYNLSKKINKSMQHIVGTEIDLLNIVWIYRAKKYFNYSKDEIRKILIPVNYRINKNKLEELLSCADFNDIKSVLNTTIYKKVFTEENRLEYEKDKFLHDINIKLFRTKMFNICTVYAILNLIDIEIKNIINIVEGIRYKLEKSEIRKKIII